MIIFIFLCGAFILALFYLTESAYLPNTVEKWIYEPMFFRSFAFALMLFGLSGAMLYGFKVDPLFTTLLAAAIGLIGFFAIFFLLKKDTKK